MANELLGASASLTENGGHCRRPVRISERFAKAVLTSTLEGGTLYTEAFEMLSVKKLSVFDELASRLAVSLHAGAQNAPVQSALELQETRRSIP